MPEVRGKIAATDGRKMLVWVDSDASARKLQKQYDAGNDDVMLAYDDGIGITTKQRAFIFSLISDIYDAQIGGYSDYLGGSVLDNKNWLYEDFKLRYTLLYGEVYSSSVAGGTMAAANKFIELLLEFAMDHRIALSKRPLDELQPSEIGKFEYMCLMTKQCAICGTYPSDLHHMDTIGMGNDRTRVNHIGRRAIQLCRKHHQEIEATSTSEFLKKHHLNGIKIDEEIARVHNLRTKERKE